jgi:hypothetical protein
LENTEEFLGYYHKTRNRAYLNYLIVSNLNRKIYHVFLLYPDLTFGGGKAGLISEPTLYHWESSLASLATFQTAGPEIKVTFRYNPKASSIFLTSFSDQESFA